jgi:hypothetical protein
MTKELSLYFIESVLTPGTGMNVLMISSKLIIKNKIPHVIKIWLNASIDVDVF